MSTITIKMSGFPFQVDRIDTSSKESIVSFLTSQNQAILNAAIAALTDEYKKPAGTWYDHKSLAKLAALQGGQLILSKRPNRNMRSKLWVKYPKCAYCNQVCTPDNPVHVDHILPSKANTNAAIMSAFGFTTLLDQRSPTGDRKTDIQHTNCVLSCATCNSAIKKEGLPIVFKGRNGYDIEAIASRIAAVMLAAKESRLKVECISETNNDWVLKNAPGCLAEFQ